ncbi:MAG: hypothetical protein J1F16_04460 [Muribaculaceae bacterium]|nr:hypothetical protein [Muribaculaceae bacterium]
MDLDSLRYMWEAHFSNPLWHPRDARRIRRENARVAHRMRKLKKYIPFVEQLQAPPQEEISPESEKMFSLWYQGENNAPDLIKKCLASVRKFYPDNFIVLDSQNLAEHTQIPDAIIQKWQQGKIIAPNFSDVVRIDLLAREGGCWFDATDFLTGPVPEKIMDCDFFMFVPNKRSYTHMFVQTCFIRAKQGNPLMKMWRDLIFEYWLNEEKAVDYFLAHFLFRLLVTYNQEAKDLFAKMPKIEMDPTHVLWHKIGNLPYSIALEEEMRKGAFFQKCSYKPQGSRHAVNQIIPGSMADVVVNDKKAGEN